MILIVQFSTIQLLSGLGRSIDLIISVNSGFAHSPPWDCFWMPGSWVWLQWWVKGVGELGETGNRSQVLGHHLPPWAPAEIPSSWEVLIESRTLQLWLASSRRLFSLGPREIWLLSRTSWWPRRLWGNTVRSYLPNSLCRHLYSSAPGLCWAPSSALKWPHISVGPAWVWEDGAVFLLRNPPVSPHVPQRLIGTSWGRRAARELSLTDHWLLRVF